MIEDQYKKWVIENLERPGMSQTGLAKVLGLHPSAVNKIVSGKRQLKSQEVAQAAAYFGSDAPTVELRPIVEQLKPVPIIGIAEAGAFREVDEFDQSEPEYIYEPADPQFPNARRVAIELSGDSMNALEPRPLFPGDRLICVSYEDIAHEVVLRSKMVVVVQRTRDDGHFREWSVKQIEIYPDRAEFHPRSTNPKHKPIIVPRDATNDDGVSVEVIAVVRRVTNDMPGF